MDKALFSLKIPILGICYGAQLMSKVLLGEVVPGTKKEFGRARLVIDKPSALFHGLSDAIEVLMSHGDHIKSIPSHFHRLASTENTPFAAIADEERSLYGIQFHPEVAHTPQGIQILENFLFRICHLRPEWNMTSLLPKLIEQTQLQLGQEFAVCGVSGGIDSMVAAALVHKAAPGKLSCIFVDTGLMRKGERVEIENLFYELFQMPLLVVDAKERFLKALSGVLDPEEKRKRIGHLFIEVFEEAAKSQKQPASFLVQGTLYPDVIESAASKGPSSTIKTHHNVGGLPEKMRLGLIEPLRTLFKDEVRRLGQELGIPESLIKRQPFPGPGLAVRIVGEVTEKRLHKVREADAIIEEEIRKSGYYNHLWQAFAVLLPVRSVGVMGDYRTYAETIAIRAVTSEDGMTADWAELPNSLLATMSFRIVNEVKGINRVVYDITSKPPGTIEWE